MVEKVQRLTKRRVYRLVPEEVELKDLRKHDIFILQDVDGGVETGKVVNICGDDAISEHYGKVVPYVQVDEVGEIPLPIGDIVGGGDD